MMVRNEDEDIYVCLTSSGRSAETLGVTTLLGLYKVADGTHNQVFSYIILQAQVPVQTNQFKVKAQSTIYPLQPFLLFQCKYYTQLHDLDHGGGFLFRHSSAPHPWVVAPPA